MTGPAPAALLAVAAAGAAGWLATTPGHRSARAPGPRSLLLALVPSSVAAVVLLDGTRLAWVALLALAVSAGAHLDRQARRSAATSRRRAQVVEACEALLGELRSGRPLAASVRGAAETAPLLHPVASVTRLGGDVPDALRALARSPGAEGLARLAAAWSLCADTGSGLAVAVEHQLATARADLEVERSVQAELASARATARLVAVLPLVVLLAAQGIGASPWAFLLDTPAGLTCLGLGGTFGFAGLAWIERIGRDAARAGA